MAGKRIRLYIKKIPKPLFCMDCKIPVERGKYKGNVIRCKPCREIYKVKYAREFEEILVLRSCLECKELMMVERKEGNHQGKYKNYCPNCRSNHYKRRKFGYVPQVIRTCPRCKKEMSYNHMRYYKDELHCIKCKRIKIKQEIHEESLKKKEELRKIKEQQQLEISNRHCVDCDIKLEGISVRNWNTIRCGPCQEAYLRATEKNRIHKDIGTIAMSKNNHIATDKDGNPDWDEEKKKIEKIKHKTYYPFRGVYKNKQMEEHHKKKKRYREGEYG